MVLSHFLTQELKLSMNTYTNKETLNLFQDAVRSYVNSHKTVLSQYQGMYGIELKNLFLWMQSQPAYRHLNKDKLLSDLIHPSETISRLNYTLISSPGTQVDYSKLINAFISWCEYKELNNIKSHGQKRAIWLMDNYKVDVKSINTAKNSWSKLGGVVALEYLFYKREIDFDAMFSSLPNLNKNLIKEQVEDKYQKLQLPKQSIGINNGSIDYVYLIKLTNGLYKYSESARKFPSRIKSQDITIDKNFTPVAAYVEMLSSDAEKEIHKFLKKMKYQRPKYSFNDQFWIEDDSTARKLFEDALLDKNIAHKMINTNNIFN